MDRRFSLLSCNLARLKSDSPVPRVERWSQDRLAETILLALISIKRLSALPHAEVVGESSIDAGVCMSGKFLLWRKIAHSSPWLLSSNPQRDGCFSQGCMHVLVRTEHLHGAECWTYE